ncbi:MAG: NAD(P)-binding domain-containing protein [Rhizobiaceae bacterium]|nr:NAD(P)-binding domain-containing protein [Rhizobiaceae bacterium]
MIGAGSSGIAACKALSEAGIDYDCFETSDRVGGNWVFKNSNGMSSIYRSLHMNTSRSKMEFSDFPMPSDYPDYPFHEQIAVYCEQYVDHFGFRDRIRFKCGVERAQRRDDGTWLVTLQSGETREYAYLCVATGRHWFPRWPSPRYPGTFDGIEMHAHDYIDPADPHDLREKSILVVGFGNSALDIACELGRKEQNHTLYLSMRRGYWVVPRFFGGGRPADHNIEHPSKPVPLRRRLWPKRWSARRRVRDIEATLGRPEHFGLPAPERELDFTRAATSQELYNRIGSGDIVIKPGIERLDGKAVVFSDGSRNEVDAIIYATGYSIVFPFFADGFMPTGDKDLRLWNRVVDPRFDNLFFIGFMQPLCAVIPVAEQQARFVGELLAGRYRLPPPDEIAEACAPGGGRPVHFASDAYSRHIGCSDYVRELRRELERGARRARQGVIRRPEPA